MLREISSQCSLNDEPLLRAQGGFGGTEVCVTEFISIFGILRLTLPTIASDHSGMRATGWETLT
jgi:hypothetical protein